MKKHLSKIGGVAKAALGADLLNGDRRIFNKILHGTAHRNFIFIFHRRHSHIMFKQIIKPGFAEVTEFCQHAHGNGAVKILLNIGYRRSYGFVNGARHFKICSGKHSVAQGVKLRNGVKNFKPIFCAVLNNPAEKVFNIFLTRAPASICCAVGTKPERVVLRQQK